MPKKKNDEMERYTFSPDDPEPDYDSTDDGAEAAIVETSEPVVNSSKAEAVQMDENSESAQTTPLFSTLIPNLGSGTGLVTLSKSSGTMPAPITLPPPKRATPKAEKINLPAETAKQFQRGNSDSSQQSSNGKKGGQKNQKSQKNSRSVKDEGAVLAAYEGEFDDEDIAPAYIDMVAEKVTTRPRLNRPHLLDTDVAILTEIGKELGISLEDDVTKGAMVKQISAANDERDFSEEQTIYGEGVLEISRDGYGHLRAADLNYQESNQDIYLTPVYIKRYGLRVGDCVLGTIKRTNANDPRSALVKILAINGIAPSQRRGLHAFETLTPFYPTQRLLMEHGKEELSMRVVDLVTPVGRGQRGLIVAQPRTGKTIVLQKLANSILANNADVTLIVMLVDERPEEVTDMRRLVDAEVVASTFDEPAEHHAALCDIVSERAKRLVENGKHVVILLDSITRLARAYNTLAPKSASILSGGLSVNALYKPKRFFGSARNIEGGGSLTILATALIDTGSRMDELIFEEFKGTGNMELHLDRSLADRRIFPAIDITKSGTRREELLMPDQRELEVMWKIRKSLCACQDPATAMEKLLVNLKKFDNNLTFLVDTMNKLQKEE
ncbi:MAG: transcription termination factor Rho [Lentisphaeria bacterium]|nr:transcription termination factor Rho [Lentisphaeria bacterium]